MNGYVRNATPMWRHAMKRSVGPNEKIPLLELYEQYGIKHSIQEGEPFINWLREVKLKDASVWEIKYADDSDDVVEATEETESKEKKVKPKKKPTKNESRHMLKKDSPSNAFVADNTGTVEEITNLSVRDARERLPRLLDIKVLKYSLHQASQLANKDTLCRMLRKRIQELDLISKL